jgi:hypothetical protein
MNPMTLLTLTKPACFSASFPLKFFVLEASASGIVIEKVKKKYEEHLVHSNR